MNPVPLWRSRLSVQRPTAAMAPPVERAALSVLTDEAEVTHCRRVFPSLGDYFARATLRPINGVMKRKPNKGAKSHANWWCLTTVDVRMTLFEFLGKVP